MKIKAKVCRSWLAGLLVWLASVPVAQAFYNPAQGKWLSRDPIEEAGGTMIYGFVGNDGVNHQDMLGNAPAPVQPTINDNQGVRPGACGAVSWIVYWGLAPTPQFGGWLIQKVTQSWDVRRCDGTPIKFNNFPNPGTTTYWEAWQILEGIKIPADGSSDQFSNDPSKSNVGGDCTTGTFSWVGSIAAYLGYSLPPTFVRGGVPQAGDLFSTFIDPNLPTGLPMVAHELTISWNCCPAGKKEGRSTRVDGIRPFSD